MIENKLDSKIVAYALTEKFRFNPEKEWVIKPAPKKRKWMEETGWYDKDGKYKPPHANKCLPLVIANQMGWIITCPVGFTAVWNGHNAAKRGNVQFTFDDDNPRWKQSIIDQFGMGTFTLPVPYIFQTPPDTQLVTRGPTNSWKTNCQSLDAVMETDWLPYPFFQTWKIKRPNEPVRFNAGEPYAMIYPVNVNTVKSWDFIVEDIESNEDLCAEYNEWTRRRRSFQSQLGDENFRKEHGDWQKDYSLGIYSDNTKADNHYPSLGKREVSKCPFSHLWRKDDEGQSQDGS